MTKVVLISQFPLPYTKIGSWTKLYNNYINNHSNQIDIIICEKPEKEYKNINYSFVNNSIGKKIKKRVLKNPHQNFIEALDKCLKPNETYIIQLVDNFGFAKRLNDYLIKVNLRSQCYIQFFYHGFDPFYGNFQSRYFFNFIDEMVLLTKSSYQKHKDYYTIMPCQFSVLQNGINTSLFFKLSEDKKQKLKQKLNIINKTVFLWCSRDKPKKGLDFILNVWKQVYKENKLIELWIIGSKRNFEIKGVKNFGLIPNHQLSEFYQASDCYLFPTLCQEGFGLSIIEALHSGCYCIASALGGVPEVLDYGNYGKLIQNPHFTQEWKDAINQYLAEKPKTVFDSSVYTSKKWNIGMDKIINNAKFTFL